MHAGAELVAPDGVGRASRLSELADARVIELVEGIEEIADLAIPYARLPQRASSAFAATFTTWSDLAAQTVGSLLASPRAGEATVRALLVAAREAVVGARSAGERVGADACVGRLLAHLDDRDVVMLRMRSWSTPPASRPIVAEHLGTYTGWVQRHEPKACARFAALLQDPVHAEVGEHAAALRQRLGVSAPQGDVVDELLRLGLDPTSQEAQVLLHLAGPYVLTQDWFDNVAAGGSTAVDEVIDGLLLREGAVADHEMFAAVESAGVTADRVERYLQRRLPTLRRLGDRWVQWTDATGDMVASALHALGRPASAEEILALIGPVRTDKTVRNVLSIDDRFMRTSKSMWALSDWGLDEYAGISAELAARIDAAGGRLRAEDLIATTLAEVPDVSVSSIRTHLYSTLAFVVEAGLVRRRTVADGWPILPPLHSVRGVFRCEDNEIRLAVPVTPDVLRGSRTPIPASVAAAIGVSPGKQRVFSTAGDPVHVVWRLSSTSGPYAGTLRVLAQSLGATTADTLVLAFKPKTAQLEVVCVDNDATAVERCRALVGRPVRSPRAALAASLGISRGELAAVLHERGDSDLAELVVSR
ncbi:hypothetical protein B7435_29330 [Mycolicibacterium peregrinum]|nr:hypothetical protein B7435_29330 [Mycolicibacterium peregrinum]